MTRKGVGSATAALTRSLLVVYPRLWVVGFSHRADSALILEAMRAGARDFIELQSPMDSLRTVKNILEQSPALPAQPSGKMITILGARPGIGTTTAAMHLSLLLKQEYLPDQPVNMSTFAFPTLVEWAGPNHTAAMPSLHMAWPVYIALFCVFTWGKKAAWVFALPLCVGFATIYLGHHYVVDLLAGTVYALATFFMLLAALKYLQRRGKITLPGR